MEILLGIIIIAGVLALIWAVFTLPVWIAAEFLRNLSANFEEKTKMLMMLGSGLGIGGVLAYSLLAKTLSSALLTSQEKILVVILAIAPLLIIGLQLGKLMIYQQIKQRRAIARYHREKHNLIKP